MYKYTIKDMQQLAAKKNGKCLSNSYQGQDTKLKWKCQDGHQWDAAPDNLLYNNRWCPKCAKRKHFTEEKCRYIAEQLTGLDFPSSREVLGDGLEIDLYNSLYKVGIEYQGEQHYKFVKSWHKTLEGLYEIQDRDKDKLYRSQKLGIQLFTISYKQVKSDSELSSHIQDILQNANVPVVKKKFKFDRFYDQLSSLKDLRKLAKVKGGVLLSREYINCETKVRFQCKAGHIFNMQPRHVKNGHWCRKCSYKVISEKNRRLTLEDAQEAAQERGGKCLSMVYNSSKIPMKWECLAGHRWEVPFEYIRQGHWCSICGYKTTADKLRNSIEKVKQLATNRRGECLSEKYVNNRTKLQFECGEGHQWWARPGNIQQGKWCPKCANIVKLSKMNIARKVEI